MWALVCLAGAAALSAPGRRLHVRAPLATASESFDVVVVGGGVSGLATALELRRRGRSVVVLSRDLALAATRAAGGMLAPQAERLPSGPLLELCVQSRSAWPEWLASLVNAPPLRAVGGIVSPCVSPEDAIGAWVPPSEAGPAQWLDGASMCGMEPALVGGACASAGGWWYPHETWVDPVAAHEALRNTCVREGVDVRVGVDVVGLELTDAQGCACVRLGDGSKIVGSDVALAAGAWLRQLLPVPVSPQKGQMMALKSPLDVADGRARHRDYPGAPTRVVYGEKAYLIPRDGRVVVGATVENGTTSTHCDVRGTRAILDAAVALCPGLDDWIVDEQWAGLRPTVPDGAPVLGRTRWSNLWVCGGYWRNGILLAPRAAELLADAMDGQLSHADQQLLEHFRWDRFFQTQKSTPPSNSNTRPRAQNHAPGATANANAAAAKSSEPAPGATSAAAVSKSSEVPALSGYEALTATPPDQTLTARSANRNALFGAQPAPPRSDDADDDDDDAPIAPQKGATAAQTTTPQTPIAPAKGVTAAATTTPQTPPRDEGGYEAILDQKLDTMDAARAANRALLFGGAAIAPQTEEDAVGPLEFHSPPRDESGLDDFEMWICEPDGAQGQPIPRDHPPPQLRFGWTAADQIETLQPLGDAVSPWTQRLQQDAPKSAVLAASKADDLYARISANKQRAA